MNNIYLREQPPEWNKLKYICVHDHTLEAGVLEVGIKYLMYK